MSLHLNKITDAISKSASLSAKEKARLFKELEKTEKTIHGKDALLSSQARELEIEAALERVRARAMAMRRGDELAETSMILFNQLLALGFKPRACGFLIMHEESQTMDDWSANVDEHGKGIHVNSSIAFDQHPIIRQVVDTWQRGDPYFIGGLHGEELQKYYDAVTIKETSSRAIKEKVLSVTTSEYTNSFYFEYGMMYVLTAIPLTDHEINVLLRFAGVLKLTYTRFLDLQKAEAMAREARIEAALERVRGRALAMHKSEELLAVIEVVSEQLLLLDLNFDTVSFGKNSQEGDFKFWLTSSGQPKPVLINIPFLDSRVLTSVITAQKNRADFIEDVFTPEETKAWSEHMIKHSALKNFPEKVKEFILNSPGFARSSFLMKHIDLYLGNYRAIPFTAAENAIFKRFAQVFAQAYTRFLDLQKAEAQAREAQIEVALERVRSRAMGMHHSDELTEVLGVLFDQFDFLGINPVLTHLTLFDEENETFTLRITTGGKNRTIAEQRIDVNAVESWQHSFANWKKSELNAIDCIDYPPEDLSFLWELLNEVFSALPEGQKLNPSDFPDGLYTTQGHCKYGFIGFNHTRRATDEEKEIVIRFAKEFGRLYQRFQDIQKAETQAREAQIEAALERVRSKTMAMHNSEDLEDIVVSLFDEVLNLGLDKSIRCGIGILEGHEGMETRSVNSNSDGAVDLREGMLNMTIHPMLVGLKKAWKNGRKGYSYEYTGKDVRKYYEALNNEPEYQFNANLETLPEREFHRSFFFSSGTLFAFSEAPISEESSKILGRFAAVFGQTYRRFLDLQKAEALAKDAIKQASLDRVRGEIASMRATEDLKRITPLVFNELTTLGVPFFRCGVFIIHEKEKKLEVYLSAPDDHSLGVLHLPFNVNSLTQNSVENWKKNKVYHQHWNKEDFVEWTQSMLARGQIQDAATYQGAAAPPDSLDLHFIPFTQGMLYVGNTDQLQEDDIDLVRSLAEAFSIAYARYEDFVNLDRAKASIETTLNELKATQNQLVQSEKMASLGELTAGIAHEIQNPLNFVNNFSEVSKELIEEMLVEMQKGEAQEVKALAEDIIQNLEKINHHGKRADSIVKGMLQHSRSSSGKKEPTDINVLADEYLRLAYHGLRAKDKTFIASLETHFDESIGKVNVIPQDIGRVILNLITNAFYVVKEKKKKTPEGYEPTVTVTTKKAKDKVWVIVKDNGNGIPEAIKEKIFQPFFTTKPTGQGTGLGLSLSYDIVKAHGGALKVETKEGKGTTFIIQLPTL